MEDFLAQALAGAIGSSPVAAVLIWRLMKADKRVEALEERMATLVDEHTAFLTKLTGVFKKESS